MSASSAMGPVNTDGHAVRFCGKRVEDHLGAQDFHEDGEEDWETIRAFCLFPGMLRP